jgi:hypothetical protein
MNIDLLFTNKGEAGLIANENLVKKVAGVVLDTQSSTLTLEFVDMDYQELNIPIDTAFFEILDRTPQIHLGAVKEGNIAQAYQIPFMFLDDPYRRDMVSRVKQVDNPLAAFGYFIKSCVRGQPVHREDLGDESAMGCVLGDSVPSSLQFAPHLARRHQMEIAPKAAPSAPGIGPGLGGSSSSSSSSGTGRIQRRDDSDE